jgi:hypothetical protein
MPQLDNYLVTLGMKGQQIVLATMDNIRKKGKELTKKKTTINLAAKASSGSGKAVPGSEKIPGRPTIPTTPHPQQEKSDKKQEKSDKKQEESDKKQEKSDKQGKKTADKISGAMQNFAHSSAGLDPIEFTKGVTLAAGRGLSGMSIMGNSAGNIPELVATLMTTALSHVTGALESGKQATAATYAQQQRNMTVSHYGGGNVQAEAAAAGMSNSEYSSMMMRVIGSNGKLDTSLKSMVTELAKTKDVTQLGNVASGNFESVGTNKGWMMQQIMDSIGNVPPEIRQNLMKALLPQIEGDIMGNEGQGARGRAAGYANEAEAQNEKLYNVSDYKTMSAANKAINEAQVTMVTAANEMAKGIYTLIKNVENLGVKLNKLGEDARNSSIGRKILGDVEVKARK